MNKITKNKGFTLIELLVVIAIIGILSAVVLVSLNSARQKSRDARRLSDIRQIQTAMELYYNDNGAYPDQTAAGAAPTVTSIGTSGNTNTEWQDFLGLWPTSPTPEDGTCVAGAGTAAVGANDYTYFGRDATDAASDLTDPAFYRITFCIGANTGGYVAGSKIASPRGIN